MMNRDPVKDININSDTKLGDLVDQFGEAGGFVASKISTASSIVKDMNSEDCTKFVSFPADIMATGTRGLMKQIVENDMVDVVVTTCGTLDHDIARVLADYYHGDFAMDDELLRDEGVNRLGNVLVPDNSYGIPIERWMQPILEELYGEKSIGNPGKFGMSSV